MPPGDVAVWHNDGHVLCLRLEHQQVNVAEVRCPDHEGRACAHDDTDCVVRHFVNRFGLECNVGVCDAAAEVEVAWHLAGDARDLDAAQVWVMPVTDDAFAAWVASYGQ